MKTEQQWKSQQKDQGIIDGKQATQDGSKNQIEITISAGQNSTTATASGKSKLGADSTKFEKKDIHSYGAQSISGIKKSTTDAGARGASGSTTFSSLGGTAATTGSVVGQPQASQQSGQPTKKKKKKRDYGKQKMFAKTVGLEDNDKYRRFKDKERLIFNIANSKYYVIRFVAKNLFNFKLSFKNKDIQTANHWDYEPTNEKQEDWDIYWTDCGILPERIARMKPYQRCNHFPGMFQLARKNSLARNLIKMSKKFEEDYKFFPRTFLLPSEFGEFQQTFFKKQGANRPVYIVKPEAGCQGKGIFLINRSEDLNREDHYVVQKYIKKPLLIDELKFDCRLYVLLLSVEPLQIYLFKEGMARFSTEAYKQPSKKNLTNMFMHLTNYSINSKNKGKFEFNQGIDDADQGHKRTFTSILDHIQESFEDGPEKCKQLMAKIEQLIIKTFVSVLPSLRHGIKGLFQQEVQQYKTSSQVNSLCFEILGFDVLIDEKLKPWLIEINHAPSFATDTPFDFKIKKDVIADAVQLLKMTYRSKKDFLKNHKNNVQKRMLQQNKRIKPLQNGTTNGQFTTSGHSTVKKGSIKVNQDPCDLVATQVISHQQNQSQLNITPKKELNHRSDSQATHNTRQDSKSIVQSGNSALDLKSLNFQNNALDLATAKPEIKLKKQEAGNDALFERIKQTGNDDDEVESHSSDSQESDMIDGPTENKHDGCNDQNDSDDEENSDFDQELNQYKLIYPSRQNKEEDYQKFIDYAQMCYEKFTGSYSQKNKEEMLLEKQNDMKEKLALKVRADILSNKQKSQQLQFNSPLKPIGQKPATSTCQPTGSQPQKTQSTVSTTTTANSTKLPSQFSNIKHSTTMPNVGQSIIVNGASQLIPGQIFVPLNQNCNTEKNYAISNSGQQSSYLIKGNHMSPEVICKSSQNQLISPNQFDSFNNYQNAYNNDQLQHSQQRDIQKSILNQPLSMQHQSIVLNQHHPIQEVFKNINIVPSISTSVSQGQKSQLQSQNSLSKYGFQKQQFNDSGQRLNPASHPSHLNSINMQYGENYGGQNLPLTQNITGKASQVVTAHFQSAPRKPTNRTLLPLHERYDRSQGGFEPGNSPKARETAAVRSQGKNLAVTSVLTGSSVYEIDRQPNQIDGAPRIIDGDQWSKYNKIPYATRQAGSFQQTTPLEQPSSRISNICKNQVQIGMQHQEASEKTDHLTKTCPQQSTRKLHMQNAGERVGLHLTSPQKNQNGQPLVSGGAVDTQSSLRKSIANEQQDSRLQRNNSSKIMHLKHSVSPLQSKHPQMLKTKFNQDTVFDYNSQIPSNLTMNSSQNTASQKDQKMNMSKIIDTQAVAKAHQQKKHPNFFFQQALPNFMLQQPNSQIKLSNSLNMNGSQQDIPAFFIQHSQTQLQNQHFHNQNQNKQMLFMSPSARKTTNAKKVLQPAPVRSAFGGTINQNAQVLNKSQFQQIGQLNSSASKHKDLRNTVKNQQKMQLSESTKQDIVENRKHQRPVSKYEPHSGLLAENNTQLRQESICYFSMSNQKQNEASNSMGGNQSNMPTVSSFNPAIFGKSYQDMNKAVNGAESPSRHRKQRVMSSNRNSRLLNQGLIH